MTPPKKVIAWRRKHEKTQGELALLTQMNQSALSDIEHGKRFPSLHQAFAIEIVTGGHVQMSDWLRWRYAQSVKSLRPLDA